MVKSINNNTKINIDALFNRVEKSKQNGDIVWVGVSGSWRKTNEDVERAVREAVRDVISRGGGIVTGGALNVDYFATDEALKCNPEGDRIRVFLPVTLERYIAHYRKRAQEGVIAGAQAEQLIAQLERLRRTNADAIIENTKNEEVNQDTYYERNTAVVEASDAVIGFQVNNSAGVEDTLTKATNMGKYVDRVKYIIVY